MQKRIDKLFQLGCLYLLLSLVAVGAALAAAGGNALQGWGMDGTYQQQYGEGLYDEFKGTVEKFVEVTPLPGMAPGTAVVVENRDGESVTVHLGPKRFVDTGVIELAPGDKVKVMGVFTTIDEQPVFMANKIKKGEFYQAKFRRSSDGRPFWTMSAKELAGFTADFDPKEPDPEQEDRGDPDWGEKAPSDTP